MPNELKNTVEVIQKGDEIYRKAQATIHAVKKTPMSIVRESLQEAIAKVQLEIAKWQAAVRKVGRESAARK